MKFYATLAVIVLLFLLFVRLIVRNRNCITCSTVRSRMLPCLLFSCVFLLMTELFSDTATLAVVNFGLTVMLVGVMSSLFALLPVVISKIIICVCVVVESMTGIMNVALSLYDSSIRLSESCPGLTVFSVCMAAVAFVYGIINYLMDVRSIMKGGPVWTIVCISVDFVYVVSFMAVTMLFSAGASGILYTILLIVMIAAVLFRVGGSSVFVLLRNQERKIVEAMKISHHETGGDGPGMEVLYKNLYDKILEYFEANAPYLDSTLTINDLAGVVYSNKLYISRAISRYTGRNFCQFVNYYRISHAVELFRSDPDLKIVEMANRSGFNSSVSFSMAFRLFMGEKPGDWCRKERVRIGKSKK